jgi:hypothetical protein
MASHKLASTMVRRVILLCTMGAALLPCASPQQLAPILKAHWDDGRIEQYRTLPETAVKLLFASGDALIEQNSEPLKWREPAPQVLANAKFVTVSDTQHRFRVTGVVFGGQLFLFDELFCGVNPETMTRLILAAHIAPTNEHEGIRVAELYLSLSEYDLEDPTRFVASRPEDVPSEHTVKSRLSVADLLRILHSPAAVSTPFGYGVDLFTMYPGMSVRHWQLRIGSAGVANVTDQLVRSGGKVAAIDDAGRNEPEKITFQIQLMANGFTGDGGVTDITEWSASDGPGLDRVHYYFQSATGAENLMHTLMGDPISLVESGTWLDPNGKVAGTRALLILPGSDKKHLLATEVFEDTSNSSVLELNCACLRNLLATRN